MPGPLFTVPVMYTAGTPEAIPDGVNGTTSGGHPPESAGDWVCIGGWVEGTEGARIFSESVYQSGYTVTIKNDTGHAIAVVAHGVFVPGQQVLSP